MMKKGQSLVEVAITAPLLIIMFIGVFEVGWLLRNYMLLSTASREAARFATKICTLNWEGETAKEIQYTKVYSQMLASSADRIPGFNETGYFVISLFEISPYGDVVSSPVNIPYWQYSISGISKINLEETINHYVDEQIAYSNHLLKSNPQAIPTRHRFVIVEVGYDHYQLIAFPGLNLINPIPLYIKTVMRYNEGRNIKQEDLVYVCGWNE